LSPASTRSIIRTCTKAAIAPPDSAPKRFSIMAGCMEQPAIPIKGEA
jgi:hypothetical protein